MDFKLMGEEENFLHHRRPGAVARNLYQDTQRKVIMDHCLPNVQNLDIIIRQHPRQLRDKTGPVFAGDI
jgi:hypothetical protein